MSEFVESINQGVPDVSFENDRLNGSLQNDDEHIPQPVIKVWEKRNKISCKILLNSERKKTKTIIN